MRTTYFSTRQELENEVAEIEKSNPELTTQKCSLECECGESFGYRIMNVQLMTTEKLILCEACSKNN